MFTSVKCSNSNNNYNNLIITNGQFFNKSYVAGIKCFMTFVHLFSKYLTNAAICKGLFQALGNLWIGW